MLDVACLRVASACGEGGEVARVYIQSEYAASSSHIWSMHPCFPHGRQVAVRGKGTHTA